MSGYWNKSRTQETDINGDPLIGALVYFFEAATTTPLIVFQDAGLALEHPHPVETDANGRWPAVYFDEDDEFYRMRVTDADGVLLFDDDAIPIIGPSGGGGGAEVPVDPNALLKTGDMVARFGTGTKAGYVRANGRTIGSATSGATERANSDTQPLFEHLWSETTNTILAVSGGRGASAAADFAANKTIVLPDAKHRTLFGLGSMGGTAAGRISASYIDVGGIDILGSSGGEDDIILTAGNLPANLRVSGTTEAEGAHGHPTRVGDAASDPDTQGGMGLQSDSASNYAAHDSATPDDDPGNQIGMAGEHDHTFHSGALGIQASGVLTFATPPDDGDTITLDARVYTWRTTLGGSANQIKVGASAIVAATNFAAAVNLASGGAGSIYSNSTLVHPTAYAVAAGPVTTVYAKTPGTAGNSIASTQTGGEATWGAATLSGGLAATGTAHENIPPFLLITIYVRL